jgi:hypothetical protein
VAFDVEADLAEPGIQLLPTLGQVLGGQTRMTSGHTCDERIDEGQEIIGFRHGGHLPPPYGPPTKG